MENASMMKKLVGNIMSVAMEVAMWITLISCVIAGIVFARWQDISPLFGILGGGIVGMLFNIGWWLISTFQEIRNYVKEIAEKKSNPLSEPRTSHRDVYLEKGTFTDPRDGKTYKTVTIGKQTWLAENLNYEAEGSKCYDNNPANAEKYGRLYNWETAKRACPPGWHLPSDAEWQELVNLVGGDEIAGEKLKAASGWNGVDAVGFAALPGGNGSSSGSFGYVGKNGYWWSATEVNASNAYYRSMGYFSAVSSSYCGKVGLCSVRCVQD